MAALPILVPHLASRPWALVLRMMRALAVASDLAAVAAGYSLASLPLAPFTSNITTTSNVPRLSLLSTLIYSLVSVPASSLPPFLPSCLFPYSSLSPSSPSSLFPSLFSQLCTWRPVVPYIPHRRAGTGSCAKSCWLPAGATSCLQRLCHIR